MTIQEIEQNVIEVLKDRPGGVRPDKIDNKTQIGEFGLDSLDKFELAINFQKCFGIETTEKDEEKIANDMTTVSDIAELIQIKLNEKLGWRMGR